MKKIKGYLTISSLGKNIKRLLNENKKHHKTINDDIFLTQIITTEFDRYTKYLNNNEIKQIIVKPPKIKNKNWDAMIGGLVIYYCNIKWNLDAPIWAYNNNNNKWFNPFMELTKKNIKYYLELWNDTPIELRLKKIILPEVELRKI